MHIVLGVVMNWWESLDIAQQIFYGLGIVSLCLLVLQFIMTFMGLGDHDSGMPDTIDGDLSGMDAHDSGLGFLSFRSITAFFAGFGWAGVAAHSSGLPFWLTVLIAIVTGIIFMCVIYYTMYAFVKMQASGTLNYRNGLGEIASVYVTIPARRSGSGQIEILIQGRRTTAEALTSSAEPIAPATKVKVVDLVGRSTFLVEPISTDN